MNNFYFPSGVHSFPLDIPRIAVDDVELWRSIYSTHRSVIDKTVINHNGFSGAWIGLDIYRGPNYNISKDIYNANYYDCSSVFPRMFKTIFENIPMDINCIRVATSIKPFIPHTDFSVPVVSLRTILYEQNDIPTFFYVDSNGNKVYQHLPPTTNTWIYNDSTMLHGSDKLPNKSKVLFMYYGVPNFNKLKEIADRSMSLYSEFIIPVS